MTSRTATSPIGKRMAESGQQRGGYSEANPTTSFASTALEYTEQGGPLTIDAAATISSYAANLETMTIGMSDVSYPEEDVLAVMAPDTITVTIEIDGSLTLSGTASVEDYQTALQSLTFENDVDDPSTATRNLRVVVDDGEGSTRTDLTIAIIAVDDLPLVGWNSDPFEYTEGDGAQAFLSELTVFDPPGKRCVFAGVVPQFFFDVVFEHLPEVS